MAVVGGKICVGQAVNIERDLSCIDPGTHKEKCLVL